MTGAPTLHRLVHDLADLLGMRLRERAAEHGEILAEHKDQAAVDRAVAGDDAVARHLLLGHAEIVAAVLDEHVPFLEGTGVEQHLDTLARGQLAFRMLRLDAARPAAGAGRRAFFVEARAEFRASAAAFPNRHSRASGNPAASALPSVMYPRSARG